MEKPEHMEISLMDESDDYEPEESPKQSPKDNSNEHEQPQSQPQQLTCSERIYLFKEGVEIQSGALRTDFLYQLLLLIMQNPITQKLWGIDSKEKPEKKKNGDYIN